MKSIEQQITELIEAKINNIGYELYDVEYSKKGKEYYLTIYIDSENGISLDDCEKVTNEINDTLDEADYIKEQYFLEVSSPGLERILKKDKHLQNSIGEKVEMSLYTKVENNKQYEGILKNFTDKEVTLEINEQDKTFERTNIAQIKTVYNWN